jgi:hypothetical protein
VPGTYEAMSALLIVVLVWLGSGVAALIGLMAISRRGVPAPSTIPGPELEQAPAIEAVEAERKAA